MTGLDEAVIARCREAIGRRRDLTQRLDASSLLRFAAATGWDGDNRRPPLAHWAFFHEVAADADLGADGHPRPGGFLPFAPELPRRMFASAVIRFERPLVFDAPAEMALEVADVRHKQGRGGDLLFVDVARTIAQSGAPCVRETQTLVYRPAMAATPSPLPAPAPDAFVVPEGGELWRPGLANLFRFSAATFNGHRIHYDRPYAVEVEGYPGLVVHGPFLATRLAALAARRAPLASFEFRAAAPCFVDQPIRLAEVAPGELQAIRCDGVLCVTAEATY